MPDFVPPVTKVSVTSEFCGKVRSGITWAKDRCAVEAKANGYKPPRAMTRKDLGDSELKQVRNSDMKSIGQIRATFITIAH